MNKNTGVVKFYNANKGYGFIIDDESSRDIYFHVTKVEGGKELAQDDQVTYNLGEGRDNKEMAIDIELA